MEVKEGAMCMFLRLYNEIKNTNMMPIHAIHNYSIPYITNP